MPSVTLKMATIECSTCSTLLKVYPQEAPGKPNLCWNCIGRWPVQSVTVQSMPACSRRDETAILPVRRIGPSTDANGTGRNSCRQPLWPLPEDSHAQLNSLTLR
jgi:hypothetical protein